MTHDELVEKYKREGKKIEEITLPGGDKIIRYGEAVVEKKIL